MSTFKTAESVSPKHPDKICDQISDAILDAYLASDQDARVAIDVAGGHGKIYITGEITSKTDGIAVTPIVQRIAGNTIEVIENIAKQSPEIARGVDTGGAGDQGIMVGYATAETPAFLPLEVVLSRELNQFLYAIWPFDGKTQVTTLEGKIHTIVASFQHAPQKALQEAVQQWQTQQTTASSHTKTIYHINPSGDWSIGGFDADAGLTGRKLVVDNYGPAVPVGGGAFSGKDASKVDRSAAYMARKIAIDYLKKYEANEVFVYLAYAIGYNEPIQARAIVDGKEKTIEDYDLSPKGIIDTLGLKRPIFEATSRYGHFGHQEFRWEN